jgi:CheY-like chemotaxis protein
MPACARVLIVDDKRVIADSLAVILKTKGYIVRIAYSAEEALQLAPEFRPDALISDVMMPGINGVELAIRFRNEFPHCRVLLISGNMATAGLLAESERQGYVHTILPKPLHPSEVLQFLES